jgi:hypothetical protein
MTKALDSRDEALTSGHLLVKDHRERSSRRIDGDASNARQRIDDLAQPVGARVALFAAGDGNRNDCGPGAA